MIEHFSFIAALEQKLSAGKFKIFYHQYDYLSFGSWILEVGRSHKRLKFTYDGKEGVLVISKATMSSQSDWPKWQEGRSIFKGDNHLGNLILKEIEINFSSDDHQN